MKQIAILSVLLVFAITSFCQSKSLQDGNQCFDKGDYTCAIEKYNEALGTMTGRDKQIAEINLGRAKSCLEWIKTADKAFYSKNYRMAKANYRNVLNENPKDVRAKVQIEKCDQELSPTLSISKENLSFTASGGKETIIINTNAESYSIGMVPAWCTVQKNEKSFVLSCISNTRSSIRKGSISVQTANKEVRLNISQAGIVIFEPTLTVSRENIAFTSGGGVTTIIDVKTNMDDYQITRLPVWCKVTNKNLRWFSLVCDANSSGTNRSGFVTVTAGSKEVKIVLTQTAAYLTVKQKSISTRKITKTKRQKAKCFNCPKVKAPWGITAGYIQFAKQNLEGVRIGVRLEPLFKYGFGLNTGLNFEGHSHNLGKLINGQDGGGEIEEYALNVPFHFEYRLNFSKWFNVFAYGGAGINIITNSSFEDYTFPTTFEYGGGVRFNHVQFNIGESTYLGNLNNIQALGSYTEPYQNLVLAISYMF